MNCEDLIFVGQYVPDGFSVEGYSVAANKYQKKVLDFLPTSKVISVFPHSFKVIREIDNKDIDVVYNGNRGVFMSLIISFVKTFLLGLREERNCVLYYNFSLHYFGYYLASLIMRRKQVFIVADYWQKRRILAYIQDLVLRNSYGVLGLSEHIGINVNSQYLYGLVDRVMLNEDGRKSSVSFDNYLFSGSIGTETGIDLCVEVFKSMPNKRLFITGFSFGGYDIEALKDVSNEYPNINYLGQLTNDEYSDLLHTVDVCLSLRNPSDVQHQYNFPSKILEFLSFGKVVLSTLSYKYLNSSMFVFSPFDKASMIECINNIDKIEDIVVKRCAISDYLISNFGKDIFLKKINILFGYGED